jgi:para-nitrobenzyl esterase
MRALPVSDLLKFNMAQSIRVNVPPFYPLMPWGPMFDGNRYALPDLPINMITKGDFNKVPLLIGTNGDEGTMFTAAAIVEAQISPLLTDKDVAKALAHFFNDTAVELILQQYPHEGLTNYPRLAHFLRDWFFTCTSRRTARAVSDASVPTFLYQFVYPKVELHREMGDYHAAELPYVFGSKLMHAFPIFTQDDIALRDEIQTYWTNMATNLNPNIGVTPALEWPQFTRDGDKNIALDVPCRINTHLENGICDFWDRIDVKYL